MKARAELQARTRERITQSAIELHGTVGPSRTSMSAVAQRAGVRRSTLYRYFPDEAALFDACSAHWSAANPPPDLEAWAAVPAPDMRLRLALQELYPFYRRNENMLENLFRDETTVRAVGERFAAFRGYLAAAGATLMAGRRLRGPARRRTAAALGHAVAYSTWKSLASEQKLTDSEAAALICTLVDGARARPASVPHRSGS